MADGSHSQTDQEEEKSNSKLIVVDESYCTTTSRHFVIKKKFYNFHTSAAYDVFDANEQNLLLHAHGNYWSIHRTMLMKNPQGSPLLTIHEARITDKHRWEIYRGDSTDATDYICKVKRTGNLQVKTRLGVFFAGQEPNSNEGSRFQIKEESCHSTVMYEGTRVIARVEHKNTAKTFATGKEFMKVEVCEGLDYAFVMAVLLIMFMMTGNFKA